jgi:thioredoxin-dependent peroxiredoxin
MATITFKGNSVHTIGDLPAKGMKVPDFRLVRSDLADARLSDFAGMVKVFNIVPSLDTSVCALSAKRFDAEIGKLSGAVLLNVSCDLPFAASRFCKAEGLTNIQTLSEMRDKTFGRSYGVEMTDGPLAGVLARAVIVAGVDDRVIYAEQVSEIGQEPNYEAALEAVKKALTGAH